MITTLTDVYTAFTEWLNLPSCEVIDVALATIIANRLDGDPVWLFLVAPPSGSKTEIIRSLTDVPDVYPLSSLTSQTFASGFERKGTEASLLPRLDGKVLTLKDFGTVLTMYREKRAEILAQLREIYDGSFKKEFGNGKVVDWTGKVGLLAGCTPIIDHEQALDKVLGERFVIYRVKSPPSRDVATRAMLQQGWEADRRQRLREIVKGFLEEILPLPPPMPESILTRLAALAEYTARARSSVFFDTQTKEISYIPAPEGPGRLAKQLYTLARALAILRGHPAVELGDYITVGQVAQDTLPPQRYLVIKTLMNIPPGQQLTTTEIAEQTAYPTNTIRRYIQELVAFDLAVRYPGGAGRADQWSASPYLREVLEAISLPEEPEDLPTLVRGGVISE